MAFPVNTVPIEKYERFPRKRNCRKLTRECSVNSIKAEGVDPTSEFFSRKFIDDEERFKVSIGFSLRSKEKGM